MYCNIPVDDWHCRKRFHHVSLAGAASKCCTRNANRLGLGIPIARRLHERTLHTAFAVKVLGVAVGIGWQVLGHERRSAMFRKQREELAI